MNTSENGKSASQFGSGGWIIPCLLIWFLAAGLFFPLTQDEAYYFQWGLHPAAGYFDHPPGVGWLSALSGLTGPDWLNGRTATILLTLTGFFVLIRFYRLLFSAHPRHTMTAAVLGTGNAAALICGFLTTPDAVLLFFWILALHEAAFALKGQRWRWLTAGAATGLGLLGKFTMLLMGPVFLWALLRDRGKSLRSPWPWLGGVTALIFVAPNLIWNAQNDWITWKFQLRHGFAMERPETGNTSLPAPLPPSSDSPEQLLADWFRVPDVQGLISEEEAFPDSTPPGALDAFLKKVKSLSQGTTVLKRLGDFVGGQLALWGLMLIPLFMSLMGFIFRRNRKKTEKHSIIDSELRPLAIAAAFIPLLVFAAVALRGKVEANWPAMYLIGAAPVVSALIQPRLKYLIGAFLLNVALLSLVITYTHNPYVRVNPGLDRILMETHGYRKLASYLAAKAGPWGRHQPAVYADSYQLVSMLRYNQPELSVTQWPGITRPSEFVVNSRSFSPRSFRELLQSGAFFLISSEEVPPRIPEFTATNLEKITDCREGYLRHQDSWVNTDTRACGAIHRWYLTYYEKSPDPGSATDQKVELTGAGLPAG